MERYQKYSYYLIVTLGKIKKYEKVNLNVSAYNPKYKISWHGTPFLYSQTRKAGVGKS